MPAGRAFSAGGESDIIGISHGSREKRAEKEKRMEALMEWTKPQKETIETRGKNILVSAAAGSGKTAVLIERITRLVIDEKTDIDRFLITTFTNAAAAEMKSRLEKAISKQMDEPGADRSFLRRQLSMMPRANISTFHTFALEVMRRYFYLTDLEPGFSIGDDVEVSIMKNDAAARLFEDRFGEDYDAFSLFLRKYSSDRSEERIKKNIISLYDEMRSIPQYMDWAERTSRLLDAKSPSEALGLTGFIADEVEKGVAEACRLYERAAQTLEEAGIDSLSEKAAQDVEKLTDMAERLGQKDAAAEKLELFNDFISTVKFNQMRAAKSQQEDYDQVKEQVSRLRKGGKKALDDLKKKYFARTMEDYDEELRAGYEDTMYLTGLLKEFEEIFREMKADRNMVDFDDVMHYAILILRDDMAADEYRKRFRYIFIDEFQDSNMLQEAIVGRITDGRNLFMVGDVKQSIYKFRLAEPEIFRRKYQLYARQSEENSVKIDLNSNFRSKLLVTETVNRVFSSAMEGYDENARLKCTVDEVHPGMATQCHIVDGSEAEDIRGDLDPEAQLVAELIRESLGNEIYDVKKGVARKVEYRDIVVLSRSRSAIGRMERFLNNEGIPAYGENTGGYFETVEVQVFVNLLRIIDNTRQDIPLISVMRSPVFDFHVRELAAVRIEKRDGSFYDAVRAFAEADHGGDEDAAALAAKIEEMFHQIACWKELKNTVTLEELTRILLYDTGYFDYCSGLPAGKRRISNLRLLVEKAGQFEQNSHSGLYGFISYIEAMKKNNISIGEAKVLGEGENVVRVMTVHKSKGLEFPIVILTGMGRMIRYRGAGTSTVMHKDLALGMPHVDLEGKWHRKTLLQRVIEAKKAEEELEEEIRILYVAMTRAMDQLLLTGTVKDPEKLEESGGKAGSFLEMIYAPMKEAGETIEIHRGGAGAVLQARQAVSDIHMADIFDRSRKERNEEAIQLIDERLSFIYPYEDAAGVKSKYSATEMSRAGLSERDRRITAADFMRPDFSVEKKQLTAAQAGTAMHLVMEKLDFRQALSLGKGYIRQVAEELHRDQRLSDEEMEAVDIDNIDAFFRQDVGRRAATAEVMYKEREFISGRRIKGAEVIVQGMIDCYFQEDDGLVLIDYKNTHADGEADEEETVRRYEGQMRIYAEALEEAGGKAVKEAYLYLFGLKKFIPVKIADQTKIFFK